MEILEKTIEVDSRRRVGSVWAFPGSRSADCQGVFLLAHGAGAGMDHEFIDYFHRALVRAGFVAVKFNFPYKDEGRKAPDRQAVLEKTFERVLQEVRSHHSSATRVWIGGKSMGGRIASYLAAAGVAIQGAFFLGYPLHPPRRPGTLRTDHFPRLKCPLLFIQGSRDALCDLELLRRELTKVPGPASLHVIQGGDHSFAVPKKSGRSRDEVREEAIEVLLKWAAKT